MNPALEALRRRRRLRAKPESTDSPTDCLKAESMTSSSVKFAEHACAFSADGLAVERLEDFLGFSSLSPWIKALWSDDAGVCSAASKSTKC